MSIQRIAETLRYMYAMQSKTEYAQYYSDAVEFALRTMREYGRAHAIHTFELALENWRVNRAKRSTQAQTAYIAVLSCAVSLLKIM